MGVSVVYDKHIKIPLQGVKVFSVEVTALKRAIIVFMRRISIVFKASKPL